MKSGEMALTIFADYSKAFDTIDFDILVRKILKLNFSQTFYIGHLAINTIENILYKLILCTN